MITPDNAVMLAAGIMCGAVMGSFYLHYQRLLVAAQSAKDINRIQMQLMILTVSSLVLLFSGGAAGYPAFTIPYLVIVLPIIWYCYRETGKAVNR